MVVGSTNPVVNVITPTVSNPGTPSGSSIPSVVDLPGPSSSDSTPHNVPTFVIPSNGKEEVARYIVDMFPHISEGQADLLCSLYDNDTDKVVTVICEGVSLSTLLTMVKTKRMVTSSKLISVRATHIVEDALRLLYKGKYLISSPIEVELCEVPAVDLGGPRRQFFTQLLRDLPVKLGLVERNGPVCFFTCNSDSLIGEHYARLAHIIVHSVLQEGPGFPCLPKAVFYYIIGGIDEAIKHLCVEELPLPTQGMPTYYS